MCKPTRLHPLSFYCSRLSTSRGIINSTGVLIILEASESCAVRTAKACMAESTGWNPCHSYCKRKRRCDVMIMTAVFMGLTSPKSAHVRVIQKIRNLEQKRTLAKKARKVKSETMMWS
jgi:hypothetical protein